MTPDPKARAALERAENAADEIERSLWLAMAADHAIKQRAVLVGGSAVNLHTGSYRPTDIDMCARLDVEDRKNMEAAGFEHLQGDHFAFTFGDAQRWLIEFPDFQVDGDVSEIALSKDHVLTVISLESLIVDRLLQATDGTRVTFGEALRLCAAIFDSADWAVVEDELRGRDQLQPSLDLMGTYRRVVADVRDLLED